MKYTKEMYDAGELPKLGMSFAYKSGSNDCTAKVIGLAFGSRVTQVVTFEHIDYIGMLRVGCAFFDKSIFRPLDTRTDREKAIDDLNYVLMNEVEGKTTKQIAGHIIDKCIGHEFEYLTFAGDEKNDL